MFYIYLMRTTEGFIKIGQTQRTPEERRREIMKQARRQKRFYNQGGYRILASVKVSGGKLDAEGLEINTQILTKKTYNDLRYIEESNDHFQLLEPLNDAILIQRFIKTVKKAAKIHDNTLQG